MRSWPEVDASRILQSRFDTLHEYLHWRQRWNNQYSASPKRTWATQWGYACALNGGMAAFSTVNLIANIGIGHPLATQSKGGADIQSLWSKEYGELSWPLCHPPHVLPDIAKEREVKRTVSAVDSRIVRVKQAIKLIPELLYDMRRRIRTYLATR